MKTLTVVLLLAGLAGPAFAQGMSYDMKTTGDMTDPRTGVASTRVFSAGHGQFANGNTRIDFTESLMPGGMMGAGSYMIVHKSSPISTFVYPAKRQYLELNRDELAKDAADAQKSLAGMGAKTELTGVQVEMKELGAGEAIEGNATLKYQMTTDYTMNVTMMGHKTSSTQHSTTDLWIAPGLEGIMNPMGRQTNTAGSSMAPLTEAIMKAYTKVKPGMVLKTVMTSASGGEGKKRSNLITMQISNLKHATIDPAVFIVPAGYTKTEGLGGAMGAMFGDSLKAAAARAKAKGVPPPG